MSWITHCFKKKTEPRCSRCLRRYRETRLFVEGPNGIYLCTTCVDAIERNVVDGNGSTKTAGCCTFCQKDSVDVGGLVEAASGVLICHACIDVSKRLLAEEQDRRKQAGKLDETMTGTTKNQWQFSLAGMIGLVTLVAIWLSLLKCCRGAWPVVAWLSLWIVTPMIARRFFPRFPKTAVFVIIFFLILLVLLSGLIFQTMK